jgi:hypothetical protein
MVLSVKPRHCNTSYTYLIIYSGQQCACAGMTGKIGDDEKVTGSALSDIQQAGFAFEFLEQDAIVPTTTRGTGIDGVQTFGVELQPG